MVLDGLVLYNPLQAVVALALDLTSIIQDKKNYLLSSLDYFHIEILERLEVIAIEILDDL